MILAPPLPLILLGASTLFGWEGARGIRKGITRFPIQRIGLEEFERGHTMFWGIVGANFIASVVLIIVAIFSVMKGW